MPLEDARTHLFGYMRQHHGTLTFYCLDHWAEFTGIDIVALHEELTELIRFRPSAEHFLGWLRQRGKRSLLVTNAHRDSLRVKNLHANVVAQLDVDVSCHDYGAPKEAQAFWMTLMAEHPFDPARTLLIDDNYQVLAAAGEFGIRHLVTVSQPDSGRPHRDGQGYLVFNDFRELLPRPMETEDIGIG
jgi:putative hydrolase of the HAD superfamily